MKELILRLSGSRNRTTRRKYTYLVIIYGYSKRLEFRLKNSLNEKGLSLYSMNFYDLKKIYTAVSLM